MDTEDSPEKVLAQERLRRQDPNPELENFLSRVNEISDVIHCLSSSDPKLNKRGLMRADILLHEKDALSSSLLRNDTSETEPMMQVTSSRSVINKVRDPDPDSGDMSKDAFMRTVEADAKERAENRRIRKEHSDRFKKEAIKLFREQRYPDALSKFDKAIEWTRDSPLLYTNRALTYIKLELYTKSLSDCDTALRLSESCLKAILYKAKALALMGESQQARQIFQQACQLHPDSKKLIKDYETETLGKEDFIHPVG